MPDNGVREIQERLYGKTLRLKGRVADMPRDGVMKIVDGAFTLAVDISALGDDLPSQLDAGCIVEVTGSCIMDVPNWHPHAPFPKISGITSMTISDSFKFSRSILIMTITIYPPLHKRSIKPHPTVSPSRCVSLVRRASI